MPLFLPFQMGMCICCSYTLEYVIYFYFAGEYNSETLDFLILHIFETRKDNGNFRSWTTGLKGAGSRMHKFEWNCFQTQIFECLVTCWLHCLGGLEGVALLQEVHIWGWALIIYGLIWQPVHSLSFMLAVEDMIS